MNVWVLIVLGQIAGGPFPSSDVCEAYRIQAGLSLNPYASCVPQVQQAQQQPSYDPCAGMNNPRAALNCRTLYGR